MVHHLLQIAHVLKLTGIWLSNFPVGRELNGRLIRKWLGVRDVWFSERSVTYVRVRDFRLASLFTSIVRNTTSEGLFEPRMINTVLFEVFIKCSQAPTNWRPQGGLNFQVVFVALRTCKFCQGSLHVSWAVLTFQLRSFYYQCTAILVDIVNWWKVEEHLGNYQWWDLGNFHGGLLSWSST